MARKAACRLPHSALESHPKSHGADKARQLETVTVTGSRISKPNVVSPTPISVLTAAAIKATGAINIGDAMTTMPQPATAFLNAPPSSGGAYDVHAIDFVRSSVLNIPALKTSRADIGAYCTHALGGGTMRWNLDITKAISFTEHPFQEDKDESMQDNGIFGFPKWKGALRVSYSLGNWLLDWNTRYFSSMLRVTNGACRANPTCTTPTRYGAGFFNDAMVSHTFKQGGWQACAGIGNVFDRNPPADVFGVGNEGAGLYDALGRSHCVGFNYAFRPGIGPGSPGDFRKGAGSSRPLFLARSATSPHACGLFGTQTCAH